MIKVCGVGGREFQVFNSLLTDLAEENLEHGRDVFGLTRVSKIAVSLLRQLFEQRVVSIAAEGEGEKARACRFVMPTLFSFKEAGDLFQTGGAERRVGIGDEDDVSLAGRESLCCVESFLKDMPQISSAAKRVAFDERKRLLHTLWRRLNGRGREEVSIFIKEDEIEMILRCEAMQKIVHRFNGARELFAVHGKRRIKKQDEVARWCLAFTCRAASRRLR